MKKSIQLIKNGRDYLGKTIYIDRFTGNRIIPMMGNPLKKGRIPNDIIDRFIKPMHQQRWEGDMKKTLLYNIPK
jgi:hypothetical protein